MNAFTYLVARDVDSAVRAGQERGTMYLGAGTNLLDLMKGGVERPVRLVDLTQLPLGDVHTLPDGGLRIGAMVPNSDLAAHPAVKARYPLLSQALLSGASPQLRNMATVGGNLLQRTRCHYFYDTGFKACNKREPGSGCSALDGYTRQHAILGASRECIAVHPSDMCVALAALDATVRVRGSQGERAIPIAEFHRLPGDTPQKDVNLEHGELITAVDLPKPAFSKSFYLKVRDRASYAFALVSVAAALEMRGNTVKTARIALGGVAHKPWRALEAEQILQSNPFAENVLKKAADEALKSAKTYPGNAFKVELARRSIVRALQEAVA